MNLSPRRLVARLLATLSLSLAFIGTAAQATAAGGARALAEAMKLKGVRYRWGGTSARGVDCSGLVLWAYRRLGVRLPRTARAQARVGQKVRPGSLRPGDLLFFRTARGRVGHVGLYAGGGRLLHAPRTGRKVSLVPLSRYWTRRLVTARRVLKAEVAPTRRG